MPTTNTSTGRAWLVAQVSAVAAQMLQANPQLSPQQVTALLTQTARPLPHLPAERAGAGLLQPATAVAAALRRGAGRLRGFPVSGSVLREPLPGVPSCSPLGRRASSARRQSAMRFGSRRRRVVCFACIHDRINVRSAGLFWLPGPAGARGERAGELQRLAAGAVAANGGGPRLVAHARCCCRRAVMSTASG